MRFALLSLVIVACGPAAPTVDLPHNRATAQSAVAAPPPPPELVELTRILTPNVGPTVDRAKVAHLEATLGPIVTPWNPERAALTIYRQHGPNLRIDGIARDEEDVAQLVRRLAVSVAFDDVRVLSAVRRGDHLVAFEIDLTSVRADPAGGELIATSWRGLAPDPFHTIDVAPPAVTPSPAAAIELDQLKLIGIVSGDAPIAMLQTRDGKAIIVKVGDRIATVWVVEQITDHELVLINNGPSGRVEKRLSL